MRPLFHFDTTYTQLPPPLYLKQDPVPVAAPRLVIFNHVLAEALGLDATRLAQDEGVAVFSGNAVPVGAQPLAQAYAGHQFGHFTMLGDGRAILLGEHVTLEGARFDVQLKGSGRTAFSRSGDGRATLGPMLREYIISEAMHALGIPTTRSLAVVTTGDIVMREGPLPGAILTRIAASHLRVGTFEYAAAHGDVEVLRALADHAIARHYPIAAEASNPYHALLEAVIARQAALIAHWMRVGFIHGVMNTDNMSIVGETIDYGPCAFMDRYDPATVFSSIDRHGRYAFAHQPKIAQWNLARFAESLLPLLHDDRTRAIALAETAIHSFSEQFEAQWLTLMRAKLGLTTCEMGDAALIHDLLSVMHHNGADYTNTFHALDDSLASGAPPHMPDLHSWYPQWSARLARQAAPEALSLQRMRSHNPTVIPRNHKVEEALEAAVHRGDYSVMHALLRVLSNPYGHNPVDITYQQPAEDVAYRTFCGT